MKLIIDDMELEDIRAVAKELTACLKSNGYGIMEFEPVRGENGIIKGIEYELYKINR